MKRISLLSLTMLWLTCRVLAQAPDWSVNPNDFQYSMSMTAFLNIEGQDLTGTEDMVAAFVGTECRGVTKLIHVAQADRHLAYLRIYANTVGESLKFKIYRASDGKVVESPLEMNFALGAHYGDVFQAKSVAAPLLNSQAELLKVTLGDVTVLKQEFDGDRLKVLVEFDQALTALTPSFELSKGAKVYKDRVLQEIGSKPMDFTEPFTFDVLSEDQSTLKPFTVEVTNRVANSESKLIDFSVNVNGSEVSILEESILLKVPFGALLEDILVEFEISDEATLWLGEKEMKSGESKVDLQAAKTWRVRAEDLEHHTDYELRVEFIDAGINAPVTNVITPNGDGMNDIWLVKDIMGMRGYIFKIHNASGEVLYESVGYRNDWAGTHKGSKLPPGNYYYSIRSAEGDEHFTGSILIHY